MGICCLSGSNNEDHQNDAKFNSNRVNSKGSDSKPQNRIVNIRSDPLQTSRSAEIGQEDQTPYAFGIPTLDYDIKNNEASVISGNDSETPITPDDFEKLQVEVE